MTTQDFTGANVWSVNGLHFRNVAIRKSTPAHSIGRAAINCWGSMPSNPDKSKGNDVIGYRAPDPIVQIFPPSIPPQYRERNQLDPIQQNKENIQLQRIAAPDPRDDISGSDTLYTKKLENMNLQVAPFNYAGIMGVVGILAAVFAVVWFARMK